jgi:hypothetical protein
MDGPLRGGETQSPPRCRAQLPSAAAATIDYRLTTPDGDRRVFSGRTFLVGPEGWSVVSVAIPKNGEIQDALLLGLLRPEWKAESRGVR